jgi:acyl-coenzyme A thioesterase PaaI-like protein
LTAYIAVLSVLGPVAQAVTTNCSIDFMRRPDSGLLMCRAKILKLGRRLVIIDGRIFSEGSEELSAARFSMTYARP